MAIKEIKMENTVICQTCRKIFLAEEWKPIDIINKNCPNCKQRTLYWAVRTREERTEREEKEN